MKKNKKYKNPLHYLQKWRENLERAEEKKKEIEKKRETIISLLKYEFVPERMLDLRLVKRGTLPYYGKNRIRDGKEDFLRECLGKIEEDEEKIKEELEMEFLRLKGNGYLTDKEKTMKFFDTYLNGILRENGFVIDPIADDMFVQSVFESQPNLRGSKDEKKTEYHLANKEEAERRARFVEKKLQNGEVPSLLDMFSSFNIDRDVLNNKK